MRGFSRVYFVNEADAQRAIQMKEINLGGKNRKIEPIKKTTEEVWIWTLASFEEPIYVFSLPLIASP